MALKESVAAISAICSRLVFTCVPKSPEREMSTSSTTVSSRSSSNTFTYGARIRAVTFQSMLRTSSPHWYSRTSLKAMPRPLNAEWYSPAKTWWLSALVRISIFRTFFINSSGVMIRHARLDRASAYGTITVLRIFSIICSGVTFSASASYVRPIRCRRTSLQTALTSSGIT